MHRLFFTATIQELQSVNNQIDVPEYVRERIIAQDPHPFWAILEVGREGISKGDLGHLGKTSKRWTSVAIKELSEKIKTAKIFTGNHGDPEDESRPSFGEIVHAYNDEVDGKKRALAVAYIKDEKVREQIKSGELNICSIEGMVNVVNKMGNFIIDSVEKVKGLLIAKSKDAMAGFNSAGVMLSVQELGEEIVDMIKLSDVKAYIVDHNITPRALFTSDQLSNDEIVKGIVTSSTDEAKHEAEKQIKKLQREKDAIVEENKPYRLEAGKAQVKALMMEHTGVKQLSKAQALAVMDFASKNITEDAYELDASEMAKLVNEKLIAGIEFAKSLGGEAPPQNDQQQNNFFAPQGVSPQNFQEDDPYSIDDDE